MIIYKFMVVKKVTSLFSFMILWNSPIWTQNFNDADGRNAKNIATALSQGKSKFNIQQALNPTTGGSQSDLKIQTSAKILALQTSKKSQTVRGFSKDASTSTLGNSSSSLKPGREASSIANSQTRGSKSEQQIQKKITKTRQSAENIRSQAISQKNVTTTNSKQLLLDAKLARRAELKTQYNNYEAIIKTDFNRFQKIRYRDMNYNGISYDYSSFNQLFTSIKKR